MATRRLSKNANFGLFPGCETGAEPPFGNLFDLETVVDTALTRDRRSSSTRAALANDQAAVR
jgi:prolyl-tRNA editing enzyme YbaK/EbsC (Cys-tRNA(Pro) deacylase)